MILRDGSARIPTANLAEALDVLQRRYGVPIPRAAEALEPLLERALMPIELTIGIAQRAATVRATHYRRRERDLSLADAILIASASDTDTIATADPAVLAVCADEGIVTIALAVG